MKTKAQRFWQAVWERYVNKQKYTKQGNIKKRFSGILHMDSVMVSNAIWDLSDKEFTKIMKGL